MSSFDKTLSCIRVYKTIFLRLSSISLAYGAFTLFEYPPVAARLWTLLSQLALSSTPIDTKS